MTCQVITLPPPVPPTCITCKGSGCVIVPHGAYTRKVDCPGCIDANVSFLIATGNYNYQIKDYFNGGMHLLQAHQLATRDAASPESRREALYAWSGLGQTCRLEAELEKLSKGGKTSVNTGLEIRSILEAQENWRISEPPDMAVIAFCNLVEIFLDLPTWRARDEFRMNLHESRDNLPEGAVRFVAAAQYEPERGGDLSEEALSFVANTQNWTWSQFNEWKDNANYEHLVAFVACLRAYIDPNEFDGDFGFFHYNPTNR